MGYFLTIVGFVGVPVCFIVLIVRAIRKKKVKSVALTMAGLFVCFVVGIITAPNATPEETATYKAEQQLNAEQRKQAGAEKEETERLVAQEAEDKRLALEKAKQERLEAEDVEQGDELQQIGDTITYDGLEVTVKKCVFSNNLANVNGGAAPGSNNQWCVVYMDVRNPTSNIIKLRTFFAGEYGFSLVYDNDYKYLATFKKYTDFFESHDEVKPLETISATSSFELPREVIDSDKEIVVYFSKNKVDAYRVGWLIRDDATQTE